MTTAIPHFTVLELADELWPGLGTAFLADFGAQVIKVEPLQDQRPHLGERWGLPQGRWDYLRELAHRNKLSLALDLEQQEGAAILRRLFLRVDAVVTDWPMTHLQALGLDPQAACRANPRLVYVRASGLGPAGPEAEAPPLDELAAARTGMMPILPQPGQPPVYAGHGQIYGAGLVALATAIALWDREESGEGQVVDVSLFAAYMYGASLDVQAYLAMRSDRFLRPVSRLDAGNPMSGTFYRTSDGRWMTLTMPDTDRYWARFAPVVGLDPHDPRFNTHEKRCDVNRLELIRILDEAFACAPAAHWRRVMEEEGLSGDIVEDYSYPAQDLAARRNGYILDLDHPHLGLISLLGFPIYMDGTPARLDRLAPVRGQHTEALLRELLGMPAAEVEALRDRGVIP